MWVGVVWWVGGCEEGGKERRQIGREGEWMDGREKGERENGREGGREGGWVGGWVGGRETTQSGSESGTGFLTASPNGNRSKSATHWLRFCVAKKNIKAGSELGTGEHAKAEKAGNLFWATRCSTRACCSVGGAGSRRRAAAPAEERDELVELVVRLRQLPGL